MRATIVVLALHTHLAGACVRRTAALQAQRDTVLGLDLARGVLEVAPAFEVLW